MNRAVRLFLLLAAALSLAACGRFASMGAALAYKNAATLLTWTVDDYVGLTTPQKASVRDMIAREVYWHRDHELPVYRRFLASVADRSQRPYTQAEVQQGWDEVRGDYRREVERLLPPASKFLATLDEQQLARLERKLLDDEEKFEKEMTKGNAEERRARSLKKTLRVVEDWTGRLSSSQRAIVSAREDDVAPMLEQRFGERRYRATETLTLVRTRDAARIERGLHRLLLEEKSWRLPDYQAALDRRDQASINMIVQLSATLSAEQRAHLQQRLQGYIQDINDLGAPA